MQCAQSWHVNEMNHSCWQVAGKITAFDRITFGWAQTESIKQQSDIAYISKINKPREDPACPSTALYYNPLSLNSSSSTISHSLYFLSLVTHVWIGAVFSPGKLWWKTEWASAAQSMHSNLLFPWLIVRGDDYCRTESRLNPLCFEVEETQEGEEEERQKMRTNH